VRFEATPLDGAWLIHLDAIEDDRGWFARTFCIEEFAAHGLDMQVMQANSSFNRRAGTLRGMHYQAAPHGERKLIRCSRGAVYDVIVDLRRDSPSHRRWYACELDTKNGQMLYVPEGFAHGFQTLADESELTYLMSHEFVPDAARGVRWDDPAFAIHWPGSERVISARDRSYPDYHP